MLHFPEDSLALHLLLENTERLIDIVVADKYLQMETPWAAKCGKSCIQLIAQEIRRDDEMRNDVSAGRCCYSHPLTSASNRDISLSVAR